MKVYVIYREISVGCSVTNMPPEAVKFTLDGALEYIEKATADMKLKIKHLHLLNITGVRFLYKEMEVQ